ncbi:MAG TPA: hypothetical protein VK681_21425 [Reyranella sp.]|nr:hypothetical protein [Reyranella sp.]
MKTKKQRTRAKIRTAPVADDLTPEQNLLFTKLERIAAPIARARLDAAVSLGLERFRDALEDKLMIERPLIADEGLEREYAKLQQTWASLIERFDQWILEKLRSGTMVAFGIRLPISASTVAFPIPTGLWHLLELNVERGTARSEDWSYIDVRIVVGLEHLPDRVKGLIDRGLWLFGKWLMDEKIAAHRRDQRLTNSAKATPANDALHAAYGGSPQNPLHVVVAGVDERIIVKTEGIRRNTRYGKQECADAAVPNASNDRATPSCNGAATPTEVNVDQQLGETRPGPWTAMPRIKEELKRRAAAKECCPTWARESVYLHSWAKKRFKRNEQTKTPDPPSLKTIRGVLPDAYYELSPEFDRRQRFRHDS